MRGLKKSCTAFYAASQGINEWVLEFVLYGEKTLTFIPENWGLLLRHDKLHRDTDKRRIENIKGVIKKLTLNPSCSKTTHF